MQLDCVDNSIDKPPKGSMPAKTLVECLSKAPQLDVICLGDMMLDRFVYGSVSRISPEAPVPVVKHLRTTEMPGGAGNVARNAASLGLKTILIGAVGDDSEGRALADLVGAIEGIESDLVAMRGRPTTLKTRFVASGQQLLRLDSETTEWIDDTTEDTITATLQTGRETASAILISDYAKGGVTERLVQAAIDSARDRQATVIVDPKGSDYAKYGAVDIIKPNAHELSVVTELPTESDSEIEAALARAFELCDAKAFVVTRAAKGMTYCTRGSAPVHRQGEARDVFDVSGAGDTSLAALGLGLAAGGSLDDAVSLAIIASGIAVGKAGTAAVGADEVRERLIDRKRGSDGAQNLPDLLATIGAWRDAGLSIGFTNGCFDILHPGHLKVLEEARSRCGRLVVGLNSDASVKRLKGPTRPINDEAARARVLTGLTAVDAVVLFEQDTPAELIDAIKPDLLVKGGDYTIDKIVGADTVLARGGAVHIVPTLDGHSTTSTLSRASKEQT